MIIYPSKKVIPGKRDPHVTPYNSINFISKPLICPNKESQPVFFLLQNRLFLGQVLTFTVWNKLFEINHLICWGHTLAPFWFRSLYSVLLNLIAASIFFSHWTVRKVRSLHTAQLSVQIATSLLLWVIIIDTVLHLASVQHFLFTYLYHMVSVSICILLRC